MPTSGPPPATPSRQQRSRRTMSGKHIAELNVARLLYDINDPRVSDFVGNLDRVNAAAERSPGFVWRLKEEAGD
ncbi:MAG: DUF3291 domain-containing protein, partial [Roseibium sp.]|uniref:DUF3291 domain-containing protein n=1 Tax=Roseibium sp. TaxID=1936156 RepID=UPI0032981E6F